MSGSLRRPLRAVRLLNKNICYAENNDSSGDDNDDDADDEDEPHDVIGAVSSAREERLSESAKKDLRLRSMLADIGFDGAEDDEAPPTADLWEFYPLALRACAQINAHLRKQSSDRKFRFMGVEINGGREVEIEGCVLYSCGDLVALAVEKDSVFDYAVGVIRQIGVASRAGKANHARALVIRRATSGAIVTVFVHQRSAPESGAPSTRVGSADYLATADGRVVFESIALDAQAPTARPALELLCHLSQTEPYPSLPPLDGARRSRVTLSAADHTKVSALLARLNGGE